MTMNEARVELRKIAGDRLVSSTIYITEDRNGYVASECRVAIIDEKPYFHGKGASWEEALFNLRAAMNGEHEANVEQMAVGA